MKMNKKNWLIALAGAAAAEAVRVVASSKKTRELAVKGLAKGMRVSDRVKENMNNLKEDAQDLYAEAKMESKVQTVKEEAEALKEKVEENVEA